MSDDLEMRVIVLRLQHETKGITKNKEKKRQRIRALLQLLCCLGNFLITSLGNKLACCEEEDPSQFLSRVESSPKN